MNARLPPKLVRPKTIGALPRVRLFALLDALLRERNIVWISGPPGAGKTVLASTYVESRKRPLLWYRFDAGDNDPASLYYFLGVAAAKLNRKGSDALPLATPEYMQDLEGFARRYFRQFCERVPAGAALVFDDFHEVSADAATLRAMRVLVEELPEDTRLIVTSRREPPSELARTIAAERVAFLDGSVLKLTREETRSIVLARLASGRPLADQLHELTDGWAAGVTLALERLSRAGAAELGLGSDAKESVFDYFAGEIFERLAPDAQRSLALMSFLPRLTASMAGAVTQSSSAAGILDYLYRHRIFTDRLSDHQPVYQFHSLFREFLEARAGSLLSVPEFRSASLRAAALLDEAGALHDALARYLVAGEEQPAAALIQRNAGGLIAQGRGSTLRALVDTLPAGARERHPWVQYWYAASLVQVKPTCARTILERLFERFTVCDDVLGQISSACAIIEAYQFEYVDFRAYARWLPELERLLEREPGCGSQETALRVYSSLLLAAFFHRPSPHTLERCVHTLHALLEADLPATHKVSAGSILLGYANMAGDLALAQRTLSSIGMSVESAQVSALSKLYWWGRVGLFHLHFTAGLASFEAAAAAFDRAIEIGQREGLQSFAVLFAYTRALCAVAAGDKEGARTRYAALRSQVDPSRLLIYSHVKQLEAMLALADGNLLEARRSADAAVQAAQDAGFFYLTSTWSIFQAFVLAESGAYPDMSASLDAARKLVADTCLDHYEADFLLIEAYALFKQGAREAGVRRLQEGLLRLNPAHVFGVRWLPGLLPAMCHEALDAGICVAQVRELIRRHAIRPSRQSESWPWPVRIVTLGRFGITLEGEPLKQSGKQQKRPLLLLKGLVALGGRSVGVGELAAALWPDLDGDNARNAFNMAAHRLRKLLRNDAAILVQAGTVSLEPSCCWVDVWAFQQVCMRVAEVARETDLAPELDDLAERCLQLYQGAFLADEEDTAWLIAQRERLRGKLHLVIESIGTALERHERWDAALKLYQRAIDMDPLAEQFYRRLMSALSSQGLFAEAVGTYRKCRQMLSIVLGVEPSEATKRLYASIKSLASSL